MIFQTPIEIAIRNLEAIGFFQFILPYMITSAIFYGLLRKSQLFGDPDRNVVVNAIIALSAALLVWASPILLGITNFEKMLSLFIMQGLSIMFVFIIGILIMSMFIGPNLPEKFAELIGNRKTAFYFSLAIIGILIGVGLLFTSGLTSILFPRGVIFGEIPEEVITTIIVFIFIIAVVLIFAFIK
ncbi:MAG: hypothetical protein QW641_00990 [Candidatus Aenigmatarchaeota archaeon]